MSYKVLLENLRILQGRQNNTEMAHQIGAKSPVTWSARLERPGSLTLDELSKLSKRYGVSIVSMLQTPFFQGGANK